MTLILHPFIFLLGKIVEYVPPNEQNIVGRRVHSPKWIPLDHRMDEFKLAKNQIIFKQ
jgi:hypothetical protein